MIMCLKSWGIIKDDIEEEESIDKEIDIEESRFIIA